MQDLRICPARVIHESATLFCLYSASCESCTTCAKSSVNIIVNNVRLWNQSEAQTIVITNGLVEAITAEQTDVGRQSDYSAHEKMDAGSSLAVPGLIDLYARLREPGFTRKGTIGSESAAAKRAGFTRILCTPDTEPAIDSVATVELVRQRTGTAAEGVKIIPMAALTVGLAGEHLTELATLQAAGCALATQADTPLMSTTVLHSAMEYAASFDMPLLMTARDAQLGAQGCAHAGAVATRLGLPQIPVAAETVALARLIELCRDTGCQMHISRISSSRAVRQIDEAKQAGLPITCDVGIQHIFYIDALIAGYDASFNSAVPFRSAKDRQALREGLASGVIDAICSDHAPHDRDAALAPFPETEPGLSTYDWFIPLLMQVPDATGLSLQKVIEKLIAMPAALLNLPYPSTITVGKAADFILLAPEERPLIADNIISAGQNNPLAIHKPENLGLQSLRGRVKAVVTQSSVTHYDESPPLT